MATIEDLNYKSLSEMSINEAIEHLRQIRLSRRIPVKKARKVKKVVKKQNKKMPELTPEQAKKLLEMLNES